MSYDTHHMCDTVIEIKEQEHEERNLKYAELRDVDKDKTTPNLMLPAIK